MDTGDIRDFSEETNEDTSQQISPSEEENQINNSEEDVEYEYVDEEGKPISKEELKDYESEEDVEYEYVDEDGNPISEEELEKDVEYVDEDRIQPETIIETPPAIEPTETIIQEPEHSIIEPAPSVEVQESIQEETPPAIEPVKEKTPEQEDMDQFIKNAQTAQEEIKENNSPVTKDSNSEETTEELLQRLTMNKTRETAVSPQREDVNPANPNEIANRDMDKITKITERLFFNSDDGIKKLKEREKEKNLR